MAIKRRNKISASFNMSSLTDVIFLLLLFFIIISRLIPSALKLNYPNADPKDKPKEKIDLVISTDLEYSIDGEVVEFSDLQQRLTAELKEKDARAILLHMDQNLEVQRLVDVMNIGVKLKVPVLLATIKKEK